MQQRGFGNKVGFGERPALLVIDFIKGFTDTNCPLGSNLDDEVAATKKLLDSFRYRTICPFILRRRLMMKKWFRRVFLSKKFRVLHILKIGSHWIEIDESLAPISGEVVWTKQYASAFFGTSLASALFSAKG